jgi:hypothetical protein
MQDIPAPPDAVLNAVQDFSPDPLFYRFSTQ